VESVLGKWTDIDLLYSLHTMALKYGKNWSKYANDEGEHGQRLSAAGIVGKDCYDKIRCSVPFQSRNPEIMDEIFLSGFEKCIPAWRFWWSKDWHDKKSCEEVKGYTWTKPTGKKDKSGNILCTVQNISCDFYA
jgi:hypothetical protein